MSRSFPSFVLALAAFALATPFAAHARTVEHRLANGLRIVVKEDRRAPTVVQQLWYRVGSMDEEVGATGLAHVLEHMMFKGTRLHEGGEFSRRITEAGGRENAFTSRDATAYFQQVHKMHLGLVMALEADRMSNLVVRDEEFAKEVRVVMEERRLRTEDDPRSLLDENVNAAAFLAHPYRWPIVGWMGDLQALNAANVRAFYRRWYAPNNAVLVVVGDVSAEEVIRLATRHYGPHKQKALPQRAAVAEPAQRGQRRVTVKAPAEQGYLIMAYKAPVLRPGADDWEPYALEVLGTVLAGHEAARLNQRLVREQRVAHAAEAWYDAIGRGPGSFGFGGVPAKSAADLEQALRAEAAAVSSELVAADELERAKTQAVAREVFKRDSIFAQAMDIGRYEIAGHSWREEERFAERLKAVTAEQVRAVARKYLVDDALTVGVLEPQPVERRPKPPAAKP
jgi:zinc protease